MLNKFAKFSNGHTIVLRGLQTCVSSIDAISYLAGYVHPWHLIQSADLPGILRKLRHLGLNVLEGLES